MPSKPLGLYERRTIPKNQGMKKKQERRAQTQESKELYARLRQKQNQLSLKERLESLDVSSNVIQHEDHLLATITLNYTLGKPESMEKILTIYDFPADEEKIEKFLESVPTKTYIGNLNQGQYKIKISSDLVKNSEEIQFSITNMTTKNVEDYLKLIKVVGDYISSMYDLRYGNERNKRQSRMNDL
ncbi:MAG: hypothetical protein PHU51_05645 [Candidatus Nanoarchaeia archaeon]|nr:hypothetical protein [Candidatus Nanoarchaeia archaeon]